MFGFSRRKKYLIYPPFQIALLLANVIGTLACLGIIAGLLGSSFSEMVTLGQKAGFSEGHPYFQFLSVAASSLVTKLLAAVAIALVVNSLLFVWLSHRLVGPIYGLKLYLARYLEARARGESISPVEFRKGDFFQDLAIQVNEALLSSPSSRPTGSSGEKSK